MAFALATLGVAAVPAQANSYCGGYYSGYFCFYDYTSFGTLLKQAYYCGSYDLPAGTWDRTSSYIDHQYYDGGWPWVDVISWKVAPDYEYLWGASSEIQLEMSNVGSFANNKADHYYNIC